MSKEGNISNVGFKEVVSSKEELQSILGIPSEVVNNKIIHNIDNHCRNYISKSPMIFISSSDAAGNCDVSPRGDEAGFVYVLDERLLVIPERPGNKRCDTLKNILENPKVGLIFIIPGLGETLRINGKAKIIKDENILQLLESHGKIPLVAIVVEVEECFIHCAKAFKRSHLWIPSSWPETETLPKPALILSDHIKKLNLTEDQVSDILKESYEKRMY